MAKNLKLFEHNVPYELCTSVQMGLPFVITPYIELTLKGISASAQTQFKRLAVGPAQIFKQIFKIDDRKEFVEASVYSRLKTLLFRDFRQLGDELARLGVVFD